MSQPGTGRRRRRSNEFIDAAEQVVADTGRLGYGLLSFGLGLLPRQTRAHMHNAVHELSHAFASLPGDFAAIAGQSIEEWAAEGDAPTGRVNMYEAPPASEPAEVRRVRVYEAPAGSAPAHERVGVYAAPPQPPTPEASVAPAAVAIAHIEYDPPGRDLLGEYVLLRNGASEPVNLAGWTLQDGQAKHVYTFPAFTLAPGAEVKLWTKMGVDDEANLYWNEGTPIWNNDGDTGALKDPSGVTVSTLSYPSQN